MKETIGFICLVLLVGLVTGYFIFRPLIAIGDIPGEIRKLKESVDKLSRIIKNRNEDKE